MGDFMRHVAGNLSYEIGRLQALHLDGLVGGEQGTLTELGIACGIKGVDDRGADGRN